MDFEALFDEYYGKIYVYIARRVNNAADAEDLTADVFLRAFSNLYNPQLAKFSTYIFTIASNRLKDYYRTAKKRADLFSDVLPDDNTSCGDDILDGLITLEENAELNEVLSKLPERQYEAVYRRYYLEQSFKEIGTALRVSEDAAKKVHRRALDSLKKILSKV